MAWSGLVGLAILLGGSRDGQADTEGRVAATVEASVVSDEANPYSVIAARNVFGLKPPPIALEPPQGPAPELPEVRLTGFMRKGEQWKVLLAVKTQSPVARARALTLYLTLVEGDKQGCVELVKAYPEQEKVDIINSGTPVTLTMKEEASENHIAVPAPHEIPEALRGKARVLNRRMRPRGSRSGLVPVMNAPPTDSDAAAGTMPQTP